MKDYPETHQNGIISIENWPSEIITTPGSIKGDLGVQISYDGRVWICINGVAFLRFKPIPETGITVHIHDHRTSIAKIIDLNLVKIGSKVWTYHRGKYRNGILGNRTKSTSAKTGEPIFWIKFQDELKGTYYGSTTKLAHLIYSKEPEEREAWRSYSK